MTHVIPAPPKSIPGGVEARATIEAGGQKFDLTYRVSQGPVSASGSPFLAASLLPSMRIGEPMRLDSEVSPRLLASLPVIEGIFAGWFERTRTIEVQALPGREPKAGGVAAFFSGGVDSFYTVLSHVDEIDALVFVHGFDIQPRHLELRARISASLRSAAAGLGKPLIEVETNVRAFADRYAAWSEEYHGSALASVALLLSPQFGRFYIPATFPPGYSAPWGSHKDLDPLWSTDATEIVHDGAHAGRVEKARLLAGSKVALSHLRVCWENRGDNYNCGRCEKCLRTMVNLRVAGALERGTTFPRALRLSEVARVPIPDECARVFVKDNLEGAIEIGDHALAAAISRSLVRRQGGLMERVRKGDLAGRFGRRVQMVARRPLYDWELPDMAPSPTR